jgi:hypothetical protein
VRLAARVPYADRGLEAAAELAACCEARFRASRLAGTCSSGIASSVTDTGRETTKEFRR